MYDIEKCLSCQTLCNEAYEGLVSHFHSEGVKSLQEIYNFLPILLFKAFGGPDSFGWIDKLEKEEGEDAQLFSRLFGAEGVLFQSLLYFFYSKTYFDVNLRNLPIGRKGIGISSKEGFFHERIDNKPLGSYWIRNETFECEIISKLSMIEYYLFYVIYSLIFLSARLKKLGFKEEEVPFKVYKKLVDNMFQYIFPNGPGNTKECIFNSKCINIDGIVDNRNIVVSSLFSSCIDLILEFWIRFDAANMDECIAEMIQIVIENIGVGKSKEFGNKKFSFFQSLRCKAVERIKIPLFDIIKHNFIICDFQKDKRKFNKIVDIWIFYVKLFCPDDCRENSMWFLVENSPFYTVLLDLYVECYGRTINKMNIEDIKSLYVVLKVFDEIEDKTGFITKQRLIMTEKHVDEKDYYKLMKIYSHFGIENATDHFHNSSERVKDLVVKIRYNLMSRINSKTGRRRNVGICASAGEKGNSVISEIFNFVYSFDSRHEEQEEETLIVEKIEKILYNIYKINIREDLATSGLSLYDMRSNIEDKNKPIFIKTSYKPIDSHTRSQIIKGIKKLDNRDIDFKHINSVNPRSNEVRFISSVCTYISCFLNCLFNDYFTPFLISRGYKVPPSMSRLSIDLRFLSTYTCVLCYMTLFVIYVCSCRLSYGS